MKRETLTLEAMGFHKIDAHHFVTNRGDYHIIVSTIYDYYNVVIKDRDGIVFEDMVDTIEEVCSLVESCATIMEVYYDLLDEESDYEF